MNNPRFKFPGHDKIEHVKNHVKLYREDTDERLPSVCAIVDRSKQVVGTSPMVSGKKNDAEPYRFNVINDHKGTRIKLIVIDSTNPVKLSGEANKSSLKMGEAEITGDCEVRIGNFEMTIYMPDSDD